MVSLWPFKGNNTDASTFEKTLSTLSTKITKASTKNDSLRQQARRLRVGWVLYGGFAYILVFLILALVTGWQNWGTYEYTVVAGGPLLLYGVRLAIITFYNWRVASSQDYLDSLYKQRDSTIEKLKKATKYDSTQQLLDKYGSPKPSPKQRESKQGTPKGKPPGPPEQRVFIQPPATANIRRNQPPAPSEPASAGSPASFEVQGQQQLGPGAPASPQRPQSAGEEFAPNAFTDPPPQYKPAAGQPLQYPQSVNQPRWYDRIMDALLGDDETQARNRIALICQNCRLVNGQAPPGTKGLDEVGRWRCGACGTMNGQDSEASKAMQQLVAEHGDLPVPISPNSPVHLANDGIAEREEEIEEDDADDAVVVPHDVGETEDADTPARSTRSRRSGKKS